MMNDCRAALAATFALFLGLGTPLAFSAQVHEIDPGQSRRLAKMRRVPQV